MDIIDTYSNISNRLLLLINEITELKTRAESGLTSSHSTGLEADNLQESVERIHQSLLNLQQIVPDFIQVTSPEWVENMQRSAEAARLAALILLHESLRPSLFSNRSPLPHPAFSTASDSVLDDNDKGVYIKAILDLVRDIMNYGPLPVSWPLWSLFIAGCCAADEVDRITVLRLFETALKKSNFGVSPILPTELFMNSIKLLGAKISSFIIEH
jgi:regulator of replication initiation timing